MDEEDFAEVGVPMVYNPIEITRFLKYKFLASRAD